MATDANALDGRVTVVVSARCVRGALVLVARPVGGVTRFDGVRGDFTVVVWLEDSETVRLSLRNRVSSGIAYMQGGATLRTFAEEIGLVHAP